ncbi:DUF3536 domain-containing protein [Rubidibacter lacunae]|nr:DUF3536 domain-containing protein [Rubidibacter lacunae]
MAVTSSAIAPDPLLIATGVYVTVHGHFYQPPRENPYIDAIERQPSAHPFHDWNERILHECYRPNAFARILDESEQIIDIVNNFEFLSFNIGPTLMSWLERHDLETYQRILDADRKSCERLNGHGNAIAQVYNHIILPLANEGDKRTQIRWGVADFRGRFGRDPEGMWLAETAIDYPTLSLMAAEGIRFVILAPSQAERCRLRPTEHDPDPTWHGVGGSQIDPTRPYRCYVGPPDATGDRPYVDIFFYDGPISRDMGFGDVLNSSHHLGGRLGQAVRGDRRQSQLINIATDGETFGHHKGGAEKCVAYAFIHEFPQRGWTTTNYAHYLSLCPPTWEVELKPVTAWSCSHGVDRWQDDCGCGGGGEWNQKWRRPLRDALNWLRDRLGTIFTEAGSQLLRDPWAARDAYVEVVRDRSAANAAEFLEQHQHHPLSADEQVDAWRLLEMQRHSMLMFTSCGWFFDEISRPEGTQILRYAARAIELGGDACGIQLETEFRARLRHAPSNVDCFVDGEDVYRQLVEPARVTIEQVAAHCAIGSLFAALPLTRRAYCYDVQQLDYQRQHLGTLTLAVGQLELTSQITRESEHLIFAVLHLGGWDFHCCIQPFTGRREYAQLRSHLFDSLRHASAARTISTMTEHFGTQSLGLETLFTEERHRLMQQLAAATQRRLDQLYTQVYRDNYSILAAFHRDELPVSRELQVAAEIAIAHRATLAARALEQSIAEPTHRANHLTELDAIATEAHHLRCTLDVPEARDILERLILRTLWELLHGEQPNHAELTALVERMLALGRALDAGIDLAQAQELFYAWWRDCRNTSRETDPHDRELHNLLKLGQQMAISIG